MIPDALFSLHRALPGLPTLFVARQWQFFLHSLQRNSQLWRKSGIPAWIAARGGNHIGNIDQFDGKLYASIEDAPDYRRPVIAVFDAATLAYTGVAFPLQAVDLNQGVPRVAVEGPGNLACTAERA